jgi:catechol 2,3-dioxygenase-like lactoylglutathione lyase family enzyme
MPDANEIRPKSISALTLFVSAMPRSVAFYEALGFDLFYGGSDTEFSSFRVGDSYLNLALAGSPRMGTLWGRAIIYVGDVDAMFERAQAAGIEPLFAPRDASWGERYFHLRDPDGHELSFAHPLERNKSG